MHNTATQYCHTTLFVFFFETELIAQEAREPAAIALCACYA